MRIRTSCTCYQPKRASARLPDFPGSTVPINRSTKNPHLNQRWVHRSLATTPKHRAAFYMTNLRKKINGKREWLFPLNGGPQWRVING